MKLVLARAYDWEGLYLNGTCVTQGHSVTLEEAIACIRDRGRPIADAEVKWVDDEWLVNEGYLPDNIEGVKFRQK
ncbi:MAG: hypothetical protein E5V54_22725 [Mesorhizobium sp.]|nr:MAG: hypothetical protein E5V54_22725 [Mesorhizobium sp.]